MKQNLLIEREVILMKKLTKLLAVLLVITCTISAFSINASAAKWRTGNIPANYKNSGYTTVRLDSTKKDAKIKIHAYHTFIRGGKGYEGNSRLYVTMRDTSGRWIWGSEINTGGNGKTLKLGRDHSAYRIYIREVKLPGIKYFENYWYPDYWAIECTKNCHI